MIIRAPKITLNKILSKTLTLRKISKTIDDTWGSSEESYTDYSIQGELVPITEEDLRYNPYGTIDLGDARAFVLPSYTINSTTVTVDIDDYLIFNNVQYRIEWITNHYDEKGEVFIKELRLRRVE